MKRAIKILSILAIVGGMTVIGFLFLPGVSARAAFEEFPRGQSRLIDFEVSRDALGALSRRERVDQVRDWLLFTVVSDAGLSPGEYSQAFYDLPAVRHGYLRPTANFEYGETRSCVIGEGAVVALVPAGLQPGARLDGLAHVADLHRKNLGEIPATIEVFEYDLSLGEDGEEPTAHVTRRETLAGGELFAEKNRYFESRVTNRAEFEQFMGRIDDLVYARRDGAALVVGGRKLAEYRGIRAEDVAAIWQSEEKIQAAAGPLQAKLDAFKWKWEGRTYSGESERRRLEREYAEEEAALKAELGRGRFANESGFSLDPAYDFAALRKFFDARLAAFLGQFAGPDEIARVRRALASGEINPLFDLMDEAAQGNERLRPVMTGLGDWINSAFAFQAARYDGELQGTEVGMVLFYTDLLAKIWALDYKSDSQNSDVDDFRSMPDIRVSPIYQEEMERLSHTRLWFGHHDKGFQAAEGGKSLLFARVATRVYAASSTTLQPGKEAEPNAQSEAFLGWWDNHYEDIARYEPEYQRLNQIMKWSLLIGWLNQEGDGKLLGFLKDVGVNKENWFPNWVRQNPRLKFRHWAEACPATAARLGADSKGVCFFAPGYKGSTTEALPKLASRYYEQFGRSMALAGGVSLAGKSVFKQRVPLSASTEVNSILRRSNLKYESAAGTGTMRTFDNVKYTVRSVAPDRSLALAEKEGAKMRGRFAELKPGAEVEQAVTGRGAGVEIGTKAGGAEVSRLSVTRTGNGFKVGVQSRGLDTAQTLARRGRLRDDLILPSHPEVEVVITLPDGEGVIIKLRGSDGYLKIAPDAAPTAALENGQARVADLASGAKLYRITQLTPDEARAALGGEHLLVAQSAESGGGAVTLKAAARPNAATQPVEARIDGVLIRGQRNPQTGEVYLSARELPGAALKDPSRLNGLLRSPGGDGVRLADALRRGDYADAVGSLLRSPPEARRQLSQGLSRGVERCKRLIAEGRADEALREADGLIAAYDRQPELLLLKGVARLSGRSPQAGQAVREALQRADLNNRLAFFDEVNLRLARAGQERVLVVVEDGKSALAYETASLGQGAAVAPSSLRGRAVTVLVQDSPGLNNLNWNVNTHRTVQEAVALGIADLRAVKMTSLAEFKPSLVYVREQSLVRTGSQSQTRFRAYYPSGGSRDDCREQGEQPPRQTRPCAEQGEGEVYVLVAKQ
jgi:hypothetical protein